MNDQEIDTSHNPWTTLETKRIYDNPWITVVEDQVLNPSGKPGIYGKVHFKNMAIGIIPIDTQMYTWLVGQYRYTPGEYSWEIPMGGGPLGIDALKSAQRELKEETGLSAKKWTDVLKIHTSNSVTDEFGFVFLAEDLSKGEVQFEETEQLWVKRLPFTEAIDMVLNNQITDSLSIAGILKVARILGL